jgi:outer membrane protein OmpA-like peptidoglycan-associated protein
MHARLRSALLAVSLLAAQVATAEPLGAHFTITPFGGFTMYDANFTYPTLNPLTNIAYMGGRLGFQYNSWVGLEAAGGYSPTKEDVTTGENVDYYHVSGNLMFSPWVGHYTNPYLFVGGGASRLETKQTTTTQLNQGNLEFGGGFNLWLSDRVGLRLEARDILWIPAYNSIEKTTNLVLGGGLTLAFGGKSHDTDFDGITDKKDNCIDTPHGAKVDGKGCPLDTDGDKVFDGLDQCANTPAGSVVDAKGCPLDTDGDGVFDGLDQCADTPKGALVSTQGCPSDDDKDKVPNGIDRCANTQKGCTVDETGCTTDSDGDGVCDGLDRCLNTPNGAQVSADGCPIEMLERETELLDTGMMRLHDINFETGKADLTQDSYEVLDVVGQILVKWPDLKIEVGGHSDSRGPEGMNQLLSEARASMVLSYLTHKFPALKPSQYTARGYGESKPVAPNTTALSMAKNRRVEFVVLNKDVLKRQVQKRRMLQQGENVDH